MLYCILYWGTHWFLLTRFDIWSVSPQDIWYVALIEVVFGWFISFFQIELSLDMYVSRINSPHRLCVIPYPVLNTESPGRLVHFILEVKKRSIGEDSVTAHKQLTADIWFNFPIPRSLVLPSLGQPAKSRHCPGTHRGHRRYHKFIIR